MGKSKVQMPKELEKNARLRYIRQQQLPQRRERFRYQCLMQYL